MKVREAIEMLAKGNWDAELRIDTRKEVAPVDACRFEATKKVKSISHFTFRGKPKVTLNVR